jgi:hypothetical protein
MRLSISQPSPNVVVATLSDPDHPPVTFVADTAQYTGPVPLVRYVADQGGIKPIKVKVDADQRTS